MQIQTPDELIEAKYSKWSEILPPELLRSISGPLVLCMDDYPDVWEQFSQAVRVHNNRRPKKINNLVFTTAIAVTDAKKPHIDENAMLSGYIPFPDNPDDMRLFGEYLELVLPGGVPLDFFVDIDLKDFGEAGSLPGGSKDGDVYLHHFAQGYKNRGIAAHIASADYQQSRVAAMKKRKESATDQGCSNVTFKLDVSADKQFPCFLTVMLQIAPSEP